MNRARHPCVNPALLSPQKLYRSVTLTHIPIHPQYVADYLQQSRVSCWVKCPFALSYTRDCYFDSLCLPPSTVFYCALWLGIRVFLRASHSRCIGLENVLRGGTSILFYQISMLRSRVLKTFLSDLLEVKFVWQISYPPANGVCQGNYFLPKMQKRIRRASGPVCSPILLYL